MSNEQEVSKEEAIVEKMIPQIEVIKLQSGNTLEVLPLTWGKEIKVMKLVSSFFGDSELLSAVNAISKLKDGEEDSTDAMEVLSKLIIPLINDAPEKITQIVSIITNKDVTFIEESLTSEDVLKVFVPFLKELFDKYMRMFKVAK